LKTFPGIGNPGADRILLFARIEPLAAVPSACPHVLVRVAAAEPPWPRALQAHESGLSALSLKTGVRLCKGR